MVVVLKEYGSCDNYKKTFIYLPFIFYQFLT